MKVLAVAAVHEQALCQCGAFPSRDQAAQLARFEIRQASGRFRPASVDVPLGEAQVDVRGSVAGRDLICIELTDATWLVFEKPGLRPLHKVRRRTRTDAASVTKVAVILAIDLLYRIPEHQVLRIKCPAGDDGFVPQRPPMNAVGRSVRPSPLQFPPIALNRSFGEQSGRPSVNGEKLCPGLPSRMMLYLSRTCELYQPQVVSGLVDTS